MKKKRIQKKWAILAAAAVMMAGICACGSAGGSAAQAADAKSNESMATADTMAVTEEAADYGVGAETDTAPMEEITEEGASAEEVPVSAAEETGQKLIKNVDMTVETTEYDELIASVTQKVEALGGYIESSEMNAADTYSDRWGYMTLRIPADQLNSFVEQVEENANVTYKNERVEDVTLSYVDMASHVKALRTEQETLMDMLEQATDLETIFAIQNQLTNVRYEIESYESQLRVLDNQVSYSTVYLNISEVKRETSGEGKTFGEEVKNRLGDNMYRMQQNFRTFAIAFIASLPIIVIWVVVIIVIVLVWRAIHKKRKQKKEAEYEDRRLSYKEKTEKQDKE